MSWFKLERPSQQILFPCEFDVDEPAALVRDAGADLADRLERAVTDGVKLIALTRDGRAVLVVALVA